MSGTFNFIQLEAAATSMLRKELALIVFVNALFVGALVYVPTLMPDRPFYAASIALAQIGLLCGDAVLLLWAMATANPMRMCTTIPMPERRQLRQFVLLSDCFPLALWYILQLLRGTLGLAAFLLGVLHLALGAGAIRHGLFVLGVAMLLSVRSLYNVSTIYARIVQRPVQRTLKPASARAEYGRQRAAALRSPKKSKQLNV